MNSERRHELETNDLAKKIIQAPDYFKMYGGRIALAVVVVVAVAMLVNFRVRSNRENLVAAQQALATARESVGQVGALNMMAVGQEPELVARRRQETISAAVQAIDTVNERSEDRKLLAQAAVLRGDLYWNVANLAELPAAATRPALAVEPKAEEALGQAEAAYKRVLESYGDQVQPVVTARFGLAAVAENRGEWDEARKHYEALTAGADVAEVFKTLAGMRMQALGQFEKGIYLAVSAPAAAATQATTAATTGPTTQPIR
jgi:tetratricopeptide (TPR) repeat protein